VSLNQVNALSSLDFLCFFSEETAFFSRPGRQVGRTAENEEEEENYLIDNVEHAFALFTAET
jgi:hypothetical protein